MATYQENLIAARNDAAAKLAAVMADAAHKPDYSIDGQSVSWTAYTASLRETIRQLTVDIQTADGPFEYSQRGFSP